jgi:hypothetical protein
MTENEAQYRVTFSEDLRQVVRHAKKTNFEHLLTGDESCFYGNHLHDLAGFHREPLFRLEKHKNAVHIMLGFDYLVHVGHPRSSCFACRDAV